MQVPRPGKTRKITSARTYVCTYVCVYRTYATTEACQNAQAHELACENSLSHVWLKRFLLPCDGAAWSPPKRLAAMARSTLPHRRSHGDWPPPQSWDWPPPKDPPPSQNPLGLGTTYVAAYDHIFASLIRSRELLSCWFKGLTWLKAPAECQGTYVPPEAISVLCVRTHGYTGYSWASACLAQKGSALTTEAWPNAQAHCVVAL